MYTNKWLSFTTACLLELFFGVGYCFSIYAGQFKQVMHYTQLQVQVRHAYTAFRPETPGSLYASLSL